MDSADLSTPTSDPIDAFIAEAEAIRKGSYADFVDFANTHTFSNPIAMPEDPFSEAYRSAVLESYYKIAAVHEYRPVEHESARFEDIAAPLTRQWPFSSHDPSFVGRYFMSIGLMIASIGLPVESYILEYGSGWGHIATTLGNVGYEVACVDIDPAFVQLVNLRARRDGTQVTAYVGEFGERPDGDRIVDAVYFHEAFHHALDHIAVVRRIYAMLRDGGKLVLGGEAVYPWFDIPWGLRRDGHAIWAIRQFKWMELGFHEDYFIRLLIRCGFSVRKTQIDFIGPLGLYYVAEKISHTIDLSEALSPSDEQKAGLHAVLSVADLARWTQIDIELENPTEVPITAHLLLGDSNASVTLAAGTTARIPLHLAPAAGRLTVEAEKTDGSGFLVRSLTYR